MGPTISSRGSGFMLDHAIFAPVFACRSRLPPLFTAGAFVFAHLCGSPESASDSRVILCADGKYRRIPLEPALSPLAHGGAGRVHVLKAAGNAILAPLAAEFVSAFVESVNGA